jgi:[ribosomal protein S5]-alanine N-acetyltransferase
MISYSFTTARLVINPLSGREEEIREIVGWLNNPVVTQFSEQRHYHHTIKTQQDYMFNTFIGADQYLGLYLNGRLIGTMAIHTDFPNKVSNVGLMIGDTACWGQGLGYEAWQAVCDRLFENNVRKIEAGCMACNHSMMSICSHYGMMEEGRQEDHFLHHDIPVDLVHWGKII